MHERVGSRGGQRLSRCFESDPRIRVGVSGSELHNSKIKGFALFSLIFKAEEKRALRALGPCLMSLLAGEPCPLGSLARKLPCLALRLRCGVRAGPQAVAERGLLLPRTESPGRSEYCRSWEECR